MNTETKNTPWLGMDPVGRLLRPSEVVEKTGLSRSQIYYMISQGMFPPFIKVSQRASAMPEAWLNAFVQMCAQTSMTDRGEC